MYSRMYMTLFEVDENVKSSESAGLQPRLCADPSNSAESYVPRIGYVHSAEHLFQCDRLPRFRRRCLLVHGLIRSYGLLNWLRLIHPTPASRRELLVFHSEDYVGFLEECETTDDLERSDIQTKAEEYNLSDDCAPVERLFTLVRHIAGGTLAGARALLEGTCDIAIHWEGGWHHAQRSEAAGFCYVNDAVLGILELRRSFERVLYIDLDVHHGDGVEDAFSGTDKVATVSFHQFECGFYPGTGAVDQIGFGKGRGYAVNVPFRSGLRDSTFLKVATKILPEILTAFRPNAVVCQCGADGLSRDPLGAFNLTPAALANCLLLIKNWRLPLLVLGGGGYAATNVARCWTTLTASLLGVRLDEDIPQHAFLMDYGPSYELQVDQGLRPDLNDDSYVDQVVQAVLSQVQLMVSM